MVGISSEYEDSDWCKREWRAIRSILSSRAGDIIPVRVAPGMVASLFPKLDIFLDANDMPSDEIASIIVKRVDARR